MNPSAEASQDSFPNNNQFDAKLGKIVHSSRMQMLNNRLRSNVDIRQEDLDSLTGPSKRWGHAAVEAAGKMYILGGYDGEYLGDIWQFDPESLNMTQCEVKAAPANSFTYRNFSSDRVERAPRGHLLMS